MLLFVVCCLLIVACCVDVVVCRWFGFVRLCACLVGWVFVCVVSVVVIRYVCCAPLRCRVLLCPVCFIVVCLCCFVCGACFVFCVYCLFCLFCVFCMCLFDVCVFFDVCFLRCVFL